MGEASKKNEKHLTLRFVDSLQLGSTMHVAYMRQISVPFHSCHVRSTLVMKFPITKNKALHIYNSMSTVTGSAYPFALLCLCSRCISGHIYESRSSQSQPAINMGTLSFGVYVHWLATCSDSSDSNLFLQMNTVLLFSLSLISVSSKAPCSKYVACPSWLISSANTTHVQFPSAYRSTRAP
jgi:peptidoglycan/LPS O-acetylase OafA/YrhL